MGFWDKIFGTPTQSTATADPAPSASQVPEPAPGPQDAADKLAGTLTTLRDAGFIPARDITLADLKDCQPSDLGPFYRRPLTSVLRLLDRDGQPLFGRVHVDCEPGTRLTPSDLRNYAQDLAAAAGTGSDSRVVVVPDPGNPAAGSLAIFTGNSVRDVSFTLDPDFGDPAAEAQLPAAVSPDTFEACTFFSSSDHERMVVWTSRRCPASIGAALLAENPADTRVPHEDNQ